MALRGSSEIDAAHEKAGGDRCALLQAPQSPTGQQPPHRLPFTMADVDRRSLPSLRDSGPGTDRGPPLFGGQRMPTRGVARFSNGPCPASVRCNMYGNLRAFSAARRFQLRARGRLPDPILLPDRCGKEFESPSGGRIRRRSFVFRRYRPIVSNERESLKCVSSSVSTEASSGRCGRTLDLQPPS